MTTNENLTRYRTVATCDVPGCRCLERNGVILYDGPSAEDAERATDMAPTGYVVEIETIHPRPYRRY